MDFGAISGVLLLPTVTMRVLSAHLLLHRGQSFSEGYASQSECWGHLLSLARQPQFIFQTAFSSALSHQQYE